MALAANRLALLDALRSLAEVADRHAWTRPELLESGVLEIIGGRHPVVEAHLAGTASHDGDGGIVGIAGDAFIPNDCRLGHSSPTVLLVTGPNMGGKSTFLRQTAVIVLLAQIGSFVPALSARVGMVDRILTRVGAQDDLAGGASTFMVEMVETATILHQATDRSLLVLDEIGRGTGTADGLAIARAVLEDIHDRLGARTLFATHYLELTGLDRDFPRIANVHAAAIEEDGRVIFLYRLRPGPADRSYGVQVARLAGLPSSVATRAESLLSSMESNGGLPSIERRPLPPDPMSAPRQTPHEVAQVHGRRIAESPAPTYQLAFDGFPAGSDAIERLARALQDLDLTNLTPRQALDWLFAEQSRLGGTN
jgi:DNA mismatch repair protein MutS